MALRGNLINFNLGKVLDTITRNSHTGTLTITLKDEADTQQRLIFFAKGEITLVSSASPTGFRIGEILLRQKQITEAQLKDALKEQKKRKEKLGAVLVAKGFVTEDQITEALRNQLLEELYDLFLLDEGAFEFVINQAAPEDTKKQKVLNLKIDPKPLIEEGLKRIAQWKTIQQHIKTGNEIFAPTEKALDKLDPVEIEVYAFINGELPVKDIYPKVSIGRFHCAQALQQLVIKGFIRPLTAEELIEKAEHAGSQCQPHLFRFALELEPSDIDLRLRTAGCFIRNERRQTGLKLLQEGIPRLYAFPIQKRHDFALKVLELDPVDEHALKTAMESALSLEHPHEAAEYGIRLAELLQNKRKQAHDVLQQIRDIQPPSDNLQFRIAGLWKKVNVPEKSMQHLKHLAARYEQAQDGPSLLKVLRLMLEIDPENENLQDHIREIEKKVKRKRLFSFQKAV